MMVVVDIGDHLAASNPPNDKSEPL
jgi:hypothetical protein